MRTQKRFFTQLKFLYSVFKFLPLGNDRFLKTVLKGF